MILFDNVEVSGTANDKVKVLCDPDIRLRRGMMYVVYGRGVIGVRLNRTYFNGVELQHPDRTRLAPIIIWKL